MKQISSEDHHTHELFKENCSIRRELRDAAREQVNYVSREENQRRDGDV